MEIHHVEAAIRMLEQLRVNTNERELLTANPGATHIAPECVVHLRNTGEDGTTINDFAIPIGAIRDVLTFIGFKNAPCAVVASGASPIVLNPSLGSRTSIGNSAPRAGNNSLPQPDYRLGPPHERVSDTAHSFSARFETTCAWGEKYWISVGHEMLPASVGVVSLSSGHFARLTPWVAGSKYSV
jgi:hypothetical protein